MNSEVVACCGCEHEAPKFVNSGIDSINKLRDLEEDQFREISSSLYRENFRELQDRTRTEEKLSQEVSVSILSRLGWFMYLPCML